MGLALAARARRAAARPARARGARRAAAHLSGRDTSASISTALTRPSTASSRSAGGSRDSISSSRSSASSDRRGPGACRARPRAPAARSQESSSARVAFHGVGKARHPGQHGVAGVGLAVDLAVQLEHPGSNHCRAEMARFSSRWRRRSRATSSSSARPGNGLLRPAAVAAIAQWARPRLQQHAAKVAVEHADVERLARAGTASSRSCRWLRSMSGLWSAGMGANL